MANDEAAAAALQGSESHEDLKRCMLCWKMHPYGSEVSLTTQADAPYVVKTIHPQGRSNQQQPVAAASHM